MTKAEIIDYLYEIHTHADYSIEDIADDLAIPVRHGRWIPCHPLGDDGPEGYMCSVCHVGGWEKTNFCNDCGADVRKGGDNGKAD